MILTVVDIQMLDHRTYTVRDELIANATLDVILSIQDIEVLKVFCPPCHLEIKNTNSFSKFCKFLDTLFFLKAHPFFAQPGCSYFFGRFQPQMFLMAFLARFSIFF